MNLIPSIPKVLHFIWLGNDLPETYKENILSWKRLNPDYTIKIWSTPLGMKKKSSYDDIQTFCTKNKIELVDFDEFNDLPNVNIARNILTKEKYSWRFACVSDVLRISILLRHAFTSSSFKAYDGTDLRKSFGLEEQIEAQKDFVKIQQQNKLATSMTSILSS